jgi:hypothetical protein
MSPPTVRDSNPEKEGYCAEGINRDQEWFAWNEPPESSAGNARENDAGNKKRATVGKIIAWGG